MAAGGQSCDTDAMQEKSQNTKPDGGELRRARLVVRRAEPADTASIAALSRRIYHPQPGLTAPMVRGHLNNFPDGQFLAEHEG